MRIAGYHMTTKILSLLLTGVLLSLNAGCSTATTPNNASTRSGTVNNDRRDVNRTTPTTGTNTGSTSGNTVGRATNNTN